MDPGECACSACPATPTRGRFGPAWLQVTLRPPCPATSVSVGTELPGDRASPGEARAEGPGRGSARGCGTGSRGGFRSDEAGEDTGRAGTVCSARAWLSGSVPGQRRVLLRGYSLSFRVSPFSPSGVPSLGHWAPVGSRFLARTAAPRAAAQRASTQGAPWCFAWAPCGPHESWPWQTDCTFHTEETAAFE